MKPNQALYAVSEACGSTPGKDHHPPIIAIDPGATGSIAFTIHDPPFIACIPMPKGMTNQLDILLSMTPATTYIENVGGYMPGNSGPASVKFARHIGNIEAALYILKFPTIKVSPSSWMRTLGKFSKDKMSRKREIKDLMARQYPFIKVTLTNADALGILTYAKNAQNRR